MPTASLLILAAILFVLVIFVRLAASLVETAAFVVLLAFDVLRSRIEERRHNRRRD